MINVALRANGLPTLCTDQLDLLTSDDALLRQFTASLDQLEHDRLESGMNDSFDLAVEPRTCRITLLAIIGELSVQRPAAHPELAARQARARSAGEV
jgi:hypothetical protein